MKDPIDFLQRASGLFVPRSMRFAAAPFGVCPKACCNQIPTVPCDYCKDNKGPQFMRIDVDGMDWTQYGCQCCREFNNTFYVESTGCGGGIYWDLVGPDASNDGKGPCLTLGGSSSLTITQVGSQYKVTVKFAKLGGASVVTFSKLYDEKPDCSKFSGEELTTKESSVCDLTNATCKLTAVSSAGSNPELYDFCCYVVDVDYFAVQLPSAGSCNTAGTYIADEIDTSAACYRNYTGTEYRVQVQPYGYGIYVLLGNVSDSIEYAAWHVSYASLAAMRSAMLGGPITLPLLRTSTTYCGGGTYSGTTVTLTTVLR